LQSVRTQSFVDFELVVVNDGSTDDCSKILAGFAADESRARLIERPNRGLIETRNELLREARGEFIAWMDSDDLSHPERLGRQVAAFDGDSALVCVGSDVQLVDPEGLPLAIEHYPQDDVSIRAEQARGWGMRFGSTMQRRSIALAAGGFRQPFLMGEDLDFLLRVAELGEVANLPDILYVYRQHLFNTCTAMGLNWPEYSAIILELADERREQGSDKLQRGEQIALPEIKEGDARKLMPLVLLDWARGAKSAGDRVRAFRYTLTSLALSPFQRAGWRQLAKLLLLK
jgi:glycosyltransferase involved in cell wall biosynthesis